MKKLLCALLCFGFIGLPLHSFAADEQTTTVHTTINAPKASELEELIKQEKEQQRDKNAYTEESWKAYQEALQAAEEALKNTPYDEAKINAALTKLQQAIKGLRSKQGTGTSPSGTSPNRTVATSSAKSYPRSGMAAGVGLSGIGLFLVTGALITWKKKRSNEDK
ncbi:FIVAR domain-containing protein [Enterococcus sp. DIV0756]|uniref:FIVAR domain-containing protein n=1 Tax=Enterococcus sp. DIV0756 TaxID=2774636 RepID=UPI003F21B33C